MAVERASTGTSLVDILDRVLDKGIVIDAWVRVSLVGIDLLAIEAPVVVAALIGEECLTVFGARRALFASVDPQEGVLGVRFAVGFDVSAGLHVPLSSDSLPVVASLLSGSAIALDPEGLLRCGLDASAF